MIANYLKLALRQLRRQKGYAFINIVGLALGVAACFLIALYVRDELTFDRFHANADRIFRLYRDPVPASPIDKEVALPMPAGPALKAAFPAVEESVRFDESEVLARHENVEFENQRLLYADASVLDVFSFPLKRGNPQTALQNPFSAVLSPEAADRYFRGENPLGKAISFWLDGTYRDFTVTGVAAPIPTNSSIRFDVMVPFAARLQLVEDARRVADDWQSSNSITYVLLRSRSDLAEVEAALPAFTQTYLSSLFESLRSNGFWTGSGPPFHYRMQPLTDVHLNPDVPAGLTPPSSPTYSYLLGAIALGILLLACINFTTLAIARSASRIKEISVRKVVGARRAELMRQFWTESFVMTLLAVFAGVSAAWAALPTFEELTGQELSFGPSGVWALFVLAVGITVLTGMLSGAYPAAYLSKFRPVEVFRNRAKFGGANTFTRALIVSQFAISSCLLIGTIVMSQQLDYLQARDLGFDEEQIVSVPVYRLDDGRSVEQYRQALETRPQIARVSASNISFTRFSNRMGFEHGDALYEPYSFRVDQEYIETMGMELAAGRNFDPRRPSDSTSAVIVNEAFAREMGWDDAVGRTLLELDWGALKSPEVIGVVGDFNFSSMRDEVKPAVLSMNPDQGINYLMVRLAAGAGQEALAVMKSEWESVAQDVPFQFSFLDADLEAQYRADVRWRRVVGYGSAFAILIACMGLFGLALLTVAGRTKEIGVRKILGATPAQITATLSREFIVLVLAGTAIAAPVAYLVASRWLETFAYRIGTTAFIEALFIAGVLITGIALGTVAINTVRAAQTNPAESLRYE